AKSCGASCKLRAHARRALHICVPCNVVAFPALSMTLFILQVIFLVASCLGLFFLWRTARPSDRWLRLVVAAGFLGRAVSGQLLFWVSWARLPIARSLQLGDGLWLFAEDGLTYY